jgi:hypothetical protein
MPDVPVAVPVAADVLVAPAVLVVAVVFACGTEVFGR